MILDPINKIEEIWEKDFKTKNELVLEMILEHMLDKKEIDQYVYLIHGFPEKIFWKN